MPARRSAITRSRNGVTTLTSQTQQPGKLAPRLPLCPLLNRSFLGAILCFPLMVLSQDHAKDLTKLSLEELMNIEVYSASKHPQKIAEAPASVTVITSEEIRRYGYRTLADVLQSVRGFYVNNDRNYSYVGVRGFAPPGDYNSRVLLLLDGHRLNDNVYDQALIGSELPIDIALIERIEIIRGPSSSLYGSDAFFGVINLITKTRKAFRYGQVTADIASFGSYKGHFAVAETLPFNVDMVLGGSVYESRGPAKLYFREFDSPETGNGLALNTDDDAAKNIFLKLDYRDFTLSTMAGTREKGIPTASFESVFNDPGNRTTDSEGNLVLTFNRQLNSTTSLLTRISYNRYVYDGFYVENNAGVLNRDVVRGDWWGIDGQVRKHVFRKHDVTAGGEFRDNLHQDQRNYDLAPPMLNLDVSQSSRVFAAYIQDEFRIHPKLSLNAGIRYDHYDTFGGSTNPRLGVLFYPVKDLTVKLLYGQAFRAPNVYELYYAFPGNEKANPELRPETIRTYEIVLDGRIGSHLQLSASGYYYGIRNLIHQLIDPADNLLVFRNAERIHAQGLELEAHGKWEKLEGRMSYAVQNSVEAIHHAPIPNSPRHLVKTNLLLPLLQGRLLVGAEGQYVSSRRTMAGGKVGGFALVNLTLLLPKPAKGVDVSITAYNLLGKRYSDPGGPEHVQTSLPRDGRSLRLKVSYSF